MAGIYIHIPYCHSKCAYCDFYSVARPAEASAYAAAVAREWEMRRHELGGQTVRTVYFGGGTPSILPPDVIGRMASSLPLADAVELTLEANPEDVTPEAVAAWRSAGFNRVSIGVQSLVDTELRAVGRRHSARRALDAIAMLQDGGIGRVSADLIYGLPGQTEESFGQSLEGILATGVGHLSAYSLSFEPGTRLWRWLEQGRVSEAPEELTEKMYGMLCRATAAAGMCHYEISNFAVPGQESAHNSSYWDGVTPYLGLGPGAHSLGADGVRRCVGADVRAYLADPLSVLTVEEESARERVNDRLVASLRTARGLDMASLPEWARAEIASSARGFVSGGLLEERDGRLRIPPERWLVADAVIRELLV